MEDVLVPCQRCGADGGKAFHGWALLCLKCQNEDRTEWFEKEKQ